MAITVSFTYCPVSAVENNMLGKELILLGIDGISIKLMTVCILTMRAVCRNTLLNTPKHGTQSGFLNNVSIAMIDKTDRTNPKKRGDYWRRNFKTYSAFRLSVKDNI